jgi:DNA adenine methylase
MILDSLLKNKLNFESINMSKLKALPFLRWAGGKSRFVNYFVKFTPCEGYDTYFEPFLGSGALFFALMPTKACLSDSNIMLMSCFRFVRDDPCQVYYYLHQYEQQSSKDFYYKVRDIYNNSGTSVDQAARFIYLNKTCFNGIYRVNLKGQFNVPYGYKEPPPMPSLQNLLDASALLINTELISKPYEKVLTGELNSTRNFIYLDPPYPPLNETAYFTHYTTNRFSLEDQQKVCIVANMLREKGNFVMISNSDTKEIRDIYSGWNFQSLPVTRLLAANGQRCKVSELVITSYEIQEGKLS